MENLELLFEQAIKEQENIEFEVIEESLRSSILAKRLEKNKYKDDAARDRDDNELRVYFMKKYTAVAEMRKQSTNYVKSILATTGGVLLGFAMLLVCPIGFFTTYNYADDNKWNFLIEKAYSDPEIKKYAVAIDKIIAGQHYEGREKDIKENYKLLKNTLKTKVGAWKKEYKEMKKEEKSK